MSKHLYDNLLIKGTGYVTSVQAASITGITALTSTGSKSLEIADSTDITFYGPQHVVFNDLQKTTIIGKIVTGSLSGNMSLPLVTMSMPANCSSGFRVMVSVASSDATLAAFQEYFGVALNTDGNLSCQINQLATSPVLALSPNQLNLAGDCGLVTGTRNIFAKTVSFTLNFTCTVSGNQISNLLVSYVIEHFGSSECSVTRL
jgi:hypothetical protein